MLVSVEVDVLVEGTVSSTVLSLFGSMGTSNALSVVTSSSGWGRSLPNLSNTAIAALVSLVLALTVTVPIGVPVEVLAPSADSTVCYSSTVIVAVFDLF